MWNWKIKNKVNVDKTTGDTIKNSNITIHGDNAMLTEMYRSLGRLEGEFKSQRTDIKYIRQHIEDHADRIARVECTVREMIERGKLK